jgi:hypothetical protein
VLDGSSGATGSVDDERHLGNIDSGADRPSNEGDTFVEEYRLEQAGNLTTLRLSQDTPPPEHRDTLEAGIPRALERVKQLAER